MTKPSDVPDDVWQVAYSAVETMPARAPFKMDVQLAIARAILAERERCAKVAEMMAQDDDPKTGVTWSSTFDDGYERACTDLATAIRKGEQ